MNLKDFEQQLGIEPRSQDPEFVDAKRSSVQHAAVARDALAFEDKLERALKLPVDDDLADQILAQVLPEAEQSKVRSWPRWLAVAASVALVFALGVQFGRNQQPDAAALQAAFAEHVQHETFALGLSDALEPQQVSAAFAAHGVKFQPAVGSKVTYMSKCQMGEKVGLHLVMVDAAGKRTTLMYLPDEQLQDSTSFEAIGVAARMMATADGGAAALFAHDGQDLTQLPKNLMVTL